MILYEHYARNQFYVRSLYWRSGSRKKCRGTTTPTSQFAMLTISVTFWAHSLMISWKVTPTSYLELINAFKGRFVLTLSHATQNILSWYLETARTLILIWMSATITYIPNYIIYPMYIAIFWRGFMKFSPIKCWGSVSRSRPPLDQARWGLKDQVQVLPGWCLTFHGKIPIDAGGMMPLGGYPHDLGTPQMMNRVSLSLKSRLRQLYIIF
jgi:hypothetical protein